MSSMGPNSMPVAAHAQQLALNSAPYSTFQGQDCAGIAGDSWIVVRLTQAGGMTFWWGGKSDDRWNVKHPTWEPKYTDLPVTISAKNAGIAWSVSNGTYDMVYRNGGMLGTSTSRGVVYPVNLACEPPTTK